MFESLDPAVLEAHTILVFLMHEIIHSLWLKPIWVEFDHS